MCESYNPTVHTFILSCACLNTTGLIFILFIITKINLRAIFTLIFLRMTGGGWRKLAGREEQRSGCLSSRLGRESGGKTGNITSLRVIPTVTSYYYIQYLSQILTFFVLKSGEDDKETMILMKSRALRSSELSSPSRPFSWLGVQQWPLWSIWPNWFKLTLVMFAS